MKYSKSEFLEILDKIDSISDIIYYPNIPHKKIKKKLSKLKENVSKNGIESVLSFDKARL